MPTPSTPDEVLLATSRTFYLPIVGLPDGLREAVTSAYLCLRAIDEIEDHPRLAPAVKTRLLRDISRDLQADPQGAEVRHPAPELAEVTLRIHDWITLAPTEIGPRIWDATAAMADRMAHWASHGWRIRGKADLDHYTFCAAGAVGLLLSDLWAWYDGTHTDRADAIGFGRGLQTVNILCNRADDLSRGVDFYPATWDARELHRYAADNLEHAQSYLQALPTGPARTFCHMPLALANETLNALSQGRPKLSRSEVHDIVTTNSGAPSGGTR